MRRNSHPLTLHVPEPPARPGQPADFSRLEIPAAGIARRPEVTARPGDMTDLAYGLVRVLDEAGQARGPWDPKLDPEVLKRGLRVMLTTRIYDDCMYRAQRQGKTTFYGKCTGEEAVGVAAAFALDPDDMLFTSYRQQGMLIARG